MFERMTERSREVIAAAHAYAEAANHDYIGTEHLLVALLSDPDALACKVLEEGGLTREEAMRRVDEIYPTRPKPEGLTVVDSPLRIVFTPRAKKVLELSLREALGLGHNYIGTEHLLLGLVRENEGIAARILHAVNLDGERLRNDIIRELNREGRQRGATKSDNVPQVVVTKSTGGRAIPNEEEQKAIDLLSEFMALIRSWDLLANTAELVQAIHVLQSFVVQHMLQRIEPEHWGKWFGPEPTEGTAE